MPSKTLACEFAPSGGAVAALSVKERHATGRIEVTATIVDNEAGRAGDFEINAVTKVDEYDVPAGNRTEARS